MNDHAAGESRFVSRLTRDTLALVLAGGQGSRLYELTRWRAKPAVYFGGKLRIIDFPLSNCINSGVRRMGVLTQYKAHSLIRHLVRGWSGFQASRREFVEILPASQRVGGEWYMGTADAVYQNLDIIRTHSPGLVLILAGDHVYKMDYGPLLAWHSEQSADLTVCCIEVPIEEAAGQYGVMTVDGNNRIIDFNEKPESPAPLPGRPGWCLASMGNYVFNTSFLYEQVIRDADTPDSTHDFGRDIIPSVIDRYRVYAYPFRDPATGEQGYWRDVGTLDAYWQANMELNHVVPPLDLYENDWPIYTSQPQLPPAKLVFDEPNRRGMATESMLSAGTVISGGTVRRSQLFYNSRVEAGAEVELSVVLPDCRIGAGAKVRNAIVDRGTQIPDGMVIGHNLDDDRSRGLRVTEGGRTLVTPDMLGQQLHYTR
ncbi:glucose-1-phosphate adenylyltransferase [Marinihelvus fidelis]|uniref:Glucose-1-phosphate adenylyltransferase n=1 Tax=Marinihelvus fidelis TaxID=2613842 RepID=A0A5N0T7I6_9GAMM|nr:glucose-1-phosphate adenylyltransferase [Marinihelvus fidelis]KAA9130464.1 glucose-1-phosphate adenylyltransferase [Marinihelvus fidelis]